MNNITIIGRLTADPEMRTTQNGNTVVSFSIADSSRNNNVTYFRCSMWGDRGMLIHQYLHKGDQLMVNGYMQTRQYDDALRGKVTTWEVNVTSFEFGARKSAEAQTKPTEQKPADEEDDTDIDALLGIFDGDRPF